MDGPGDDLAEMLGPDPDYDYAANTSDLIWASAVTAVVAAFITAPLWIALYRWMFR